MGMLDFLRSGSGYGDFSGYGSGSGGGPDYGSSYGSGGGAQVNTADPRGAPEMLNVPNLFESATDTGLQAAQVLGTAPAYAYERPIATTQALIQHTPFAEGFNTAAKAVDDSPVGRLVGGVNSLLESGSTALSALFHSDTARNLAATYGLDDHDPLPDSVAIAMGSERGSMGVLGLGATIVDAISGHNLSDIKTVGDYRRRAMSENGFTQQDIQALGTGEKGVFDFGDKPYSSNKLFDIGARMTLDPTNLLFGAGAITKAVRGIGFVQKAIDAGQLAEKAVGATRAAQAISEGYSASATLQGLARWSGTVGRGVAKVYVPGYNRKFAVGLSLAELGTEAASNTPLSGFMEPLFKLNHEIVNNRPYSNSTLFTLGSALNFPFRKAVADIAGPVGERAAKVLGSDMQTQVARAFGSGPTDAAKYADLVQKLGGPDELHDFVYQGLSRLALQKINPTVLEAFRGPSGNLTATAYLGKTVKDIVDERVIAGLKRNEFSGRDVVRQLKEWSENRGTEDFTDGVQFHKNGEAGPLIETWLGYRSPAAQLGKILGDRVGVVLGYNKDMLPAERYIALKQMFSQAADATGNVAVDDVRRILAQHPQLMKFDTKNFWVKYTTRDAPATASIRSINRRLDAMHATAPSIHELTHEETAWEKQAPETPKHPDGPIQDGRVQDLWSPSDGSAQVVVPTATDTIVRNMGIKTGAAREAQVIRGEARVRAVEDGIGPVIREAGYGVKAVTQNIQDGHPGISIHMDPETDLLRMREVAAVALRSGGKYLRDQQGHAQIVYSGDALAKLMERQPTIKPNAFDFRWKVGNLTPDQLHQVSQLVKKHLPLGVVDDTTGMIRMIVPDGDRKAILRTISDFKTALEGVLPADPATGHQLLNPSRRKVYAELVGNDTRVAGRAKNLSYLPRSPEVTTSAIERASAESIEYLAARNGADRLTAAGPLGSGRGRVGEAAGDGAGIGGSADAQPASGLTDTRESLAAERKALQKKWFGNYGLSQKRIAELQSVEADIARREASLRESASGLNEAVRTAEDTAANPRNPGLVVYNRALDAEADAILPRFDASLREFPIEQRQELAEFQRMLHRDYPAYTLKAEPGVSIPFREGQGSMLAEHMKARNTAQRVLFENHLVSAMGNFQHWLFDPQPNSRFRSAAKQALYSELVNAGATPKEVDAFYARLNEVASTIRSGPQNQKVKWLRSGDALPASTINELATGLGEGAFRGQPAFRPNVIAKVGEDNFWKVLDRSGSRFYRMVHDTALDAPGKTGALARMLDRGYVDFQGTKAGSTTRYVSKTFYHIFRFITDVRWWAMNAFEADILGGMKVGIEGTRFGGAGSRPVSAASLTHSGGKLPKAGEALDEVAMGGKDNGFLDQRHLAGYISSVFDKKRIASAEQVIRDLPDNYEPLRALRERFPEFGTEDLAKQLDKMMYGYDHAGVKQTIRTEAQRQLDAEDVRDMYPLLNRVYEVNQTLFNDVSQMFHGNPARSNVERVMNSYWLYWPISYQLKATRWLFGVLTDGPGRTNMGLAWKYDQLVKLHQSRLANDPEYAAIFEDHPTLWRVAQMLLPVTPGDIGVSLSRPVRYVGGELGRWKDYQQAKDPLTAASNIMSVGPLYTADLLQKAGRELFPAE